MPTRVEDIANRALDLIGVGGTIWIADIKDGSKQSTVALRQYGPSLRQLLRSAHWNFSRKRAPLTLLQDATGQTTRQQQQAGGPIMVGTGTPNMPPWTYEYAWPIDCVKARFVPMTMHNNTGIPPGNIALPSNPIMSGLNQPVHHRQIPTRFVVGTDQIPNLVGQPEDWTQIPDTSTTMGQGITGQTVILSNQRNAHLVYTSLVTYIDQWDPLFAQAMVALLGSYFAMTLVLDRKEAVRVRDDMINICKRALDQARVSDGDEGFFSNDLRPDWLRIRNSGSWGGAGWGFGADDVGVLGYGWDACSFPNGSAY